MKEEEVHIGKINEQGAICINKEGSIELWCTSSGDYIVYLYIDEDSYLYNKRYYQEEAKQLFDATARMVKKR